MQIQLVPLAKAAEPVTPMSRSALQWVAFWREFNGVEKFGAIVKVGGRLYVAYGTYTVVWWIGVGISVFSALVHLPIRERPLTPQAVAA